MDSRLHLLAGKNWFLLEAEGSLPEPEPGPLSTSAVTRTASRLPTNQIGLFVLGINDEEKAKQSFWFLCLKRVRQGCSSDLDASFYRASAGDKTTACNKTQFVHELLCALRVGFRFSQS